MTIEGTADKGTLREALRGLVNATASCPDALMQGNGDLAQQNLYRWWQDVAAPALRDARAALSSKDEPLDVARLARALLTVVPGYQRWMTNPPPDTQREASGRVEAMESEALAHAKRIAAEYAALSYAWPGLFTPDADREGLDEALFEECARVAHSTGCKPVDDHIARAFFDWDFRHCKTDRCRKAKEALAARSSSPDSPREAADADRS